MGAWLLAGCGAASLKPDAGTARGGDGAPVESGDGAPADSGDGAAADSGHDDAAAPADAGPESVDAEVGDGGGIDASPDTEGARPYRALAVVVAAEHSCALLDDHHVKCWGTNRSGELGIGDGFSRGDGPADMGNALPVVDLGTGRTATVLAAGSETTCAILDDGSVKCWGRGDLTGQPSSADVGNFPGQMGDALPALDLGGSKATHIALSGTDGCAVLDDGTARCWGAHSPARVPTAVPFDGTSPVRRLVPAAWGFLVIYEDGHLGGLLGFVPPTDWTHDVAAMDSYGSSSYESSATPAEMWIIRTDGTAENWALDSNGAWVKDTLQWSLLQANAAARPVALTWGAFHCLVFESEAPLCTAIPSFPTCTPDWCQPLNGTSPLQFRLQLGHPVAAVSGGVWMHSCFLLTNGGVRCIGGFPSPLNSNAALGSSFDLLESNGQYSWGPFHDIDLGTAP